MEHPLQNHEVKALVRKIMATGTFQYRQPHMRNRMRQRKLTTQDCENVLYAGIADGFDYENGEYRYHLRTRSIEVVIEIISDEELIIITAWRLG